MMLTMTVTEFKAHQRRELKGFHLVPYKEVRKSFKDAAFVAAIPGEDFATCSMARSVDADYVQVLTDIVACPTEAARAAYVQDYLRVFPGQNIYQMLKDVLESLSLTEAKVFLNNLTVSAPEFNWAERTLELAS